MIVETLTLVGVAGTLAATLALHRRRHRHNSEIERLEGEVARLAGILRHAETGLDERGRLIVALVRRISGKNARPIRLPHQALADAEAWAVRGEPGSAHLTLHIESRGAPTDG